MAKETSSTGAAPAARRRARATAASGTAARSRPGVAPDAARDVADRLHSAAIHLLRRLRRVDAAMGITAARASALSVLVFGGPRTIGELAAAEQVSAPTMTRMVSAMETDHLVRRAPDPADGRIVRVHPTPRGATLLRRGRSARVRELAAVLKRLPPEEVEALGRAADILRRLERT